MNAPRLQVPHIRQESPRRACVTRWGHVGGFVFRAGDSLVLSEARAERLLLLSPRGWGNPMLGRQTRAGLVAEPGNVPASPARWQVAGTVDCVERDLERAVTGGGTWSVAVRIEAMSGTTSEQVQRALRSFRGGMMKGAELDALCLRAALAEDDLGVRIAIGAAAGPERAAELAASAALGRIRLDVEMPVEDATAEGRVILGPWAPRPDEPARPEAAAEKPLVAVNDMQLTLFGDMPRQHGS